MIAFLIDADNLCASAWVDEAFLKLGESDGNPAIRRAYGSAEKLKGLTEVLRTLHVRPFVNLSLSKNTTDVALAVDAMELSYQMPRPTTIAIGSGDADFVPVVLRLRERGFRLVCVSERGKMAPEAIAAYDNVILVGPERGMDVAPTVADTPAKKAPSKKAAKKQAPAKKAAAKKAPAKKAKAVPAKVSVDSAGKITVEQILHAAPGLKGGQSLSLNEVVKLLHDAKLLGKNATSTKLFKKYPFHFELLPPKQPNQVRYILPS